MAAAIVLMAAMSGCEQKPASPPSNLVIDFILTEKLTNFQIGARSFFPESVEVYASGELPKRERFYLTVEDLRLNSRQLLRSTSLEARNSLMAALRDGVQQVSSQTRFPSTGQNGVTYHVLLGFENDTRFAYYELFVPTRQGDGSIIIPRSDSPPLIGDPLRKWLEEMQQKHPETKSGNKQ
jgi:hypothetical protein